MMTVAAPYAPLTTAGAMNPLATTTAATATAATSMVARPLHAPHAPVMSGFIVHASEGTQNASVSAAATPTTTSAATPSSPPDLLDLSFATLSQSTLDPSRLPSQIPQNNVRILHMYI